MNKSLPISLDIVTSQVQRATIQAILIDHKWMSLITPNCNCALEINNSEDLALGKKVIDLSFLSGTYK